RDVSRPPPTTCPRARQRPSPSRVHTPFYSQTPPSRRVAPFRALRKATNPSCRVDPSPKNVDVTSCGGVQHGLDPLVTPCGVDPNAQIHFARRLRKRLGVSDPPDTMRRSDQNALGPRRTSVEAQQIVSIHVARRVGASRSVWIHAARRVGDLLENGRPSRSRGGGLSGAGGGAAGRDVEVPAAWDGGGPGDRRAKNRVRHLGIA